MLDTKTKNFAETRDIQKAIGLAKKFHRGQKRKGTLVPYIVHPLEVAQILFEAGSDTKVIIAGLLHDTVEDAGVSTDKIRRKFGSEVASLVDYCSEDKTKTWEERKGHTIYSLSKVTDINVMMLVCADKLSNLKSIESDYKSEGEKVWQRFNRGKEKQRWYYQSIINNLTPIKDISMYEALEAAFASVFENGFYQPEDEQN